MLLFCGRVRIIAVRVHQVAPLTHKYSHMNAGGLNDRVTELRYRKAEKWYALRFGAEILDSGRYCREIWSIAGLSRVIDPGEPTTNHEPATIWSCSQTLAEVFRPRSHLPVQLSIVPYPISVANHVVLNTVGFLSLHLYESEV